MGKVYPQNVVFLHLLVYRGDIWRPVLAKNYSNVLYSIC